MCCAFNQILYFSLIKASFLTKFITLGDLDDFLFKIVTSALLSIFEHQFLIFQLMPPQVYSHYNWKKL